MLKKKLNNLSNYIIFSDGSIFSCKRNRIMKITLDKNIKYLRATLRDDSGNIVSYLVHRLVAEAFIPNPENKPEVNHKDGNKLNNHVSNLEWVTRKENMLHAHLLGLRDNKGEGNPKDILSEEDVLTIYNELLDGARVCDLAERYCVSRPAISDIKAKRNWYYLLEDLPPIQHKSKSNTLSEATVRWVCSEIKKGTRICDILKKAENKELNENNIYDIKRKRTFVSISKEYF